MTSAIGKLSSQTSERNDRAVDADRLTPSASPEGRKELIGFTDGARESAQDWRELL